METASLAVVSIGWIVTGIYFIMFPEDDGAWVPFTATGGVTILVVLIIIYRLGYCTPPPRRPPVPEDQPPPVPPRRRRPRSPVLNYCVHVESKEDECCICYQPLDEGVVVLPCTHAYHEKCIVPWLQLKEVCPLCIAPLRGEAQNNQ